MVINYHEMRRDIQYILSGIDYWSSEGMVKNTGILYMCRLTSSHPIIMSFWGSCTISFSLCEGKLSLNCITALRTPWPTHSVTPPFLLGPLSKTAKCHGQAFSRKVEKGKGDSSTRQEEGFDRAYWVGMREKAPCPQNFPPVQIRPDLSLELFVSYWSPPPMCFEACLLETAK